MKCYSRYNSAEQKQKRSEKSSRAAHARWDAYHASLPGPQIAPDPPADMFRMTFDNLMSGKTVVITFHPGPRLNNYRIDVDGMYWKTCGFVAALRLIEKSCYKMRRSS